MKHAQLTILLLLCLSFGTARAQGGISNRTSSTRISVTQSKRPIQLKTSIVTQKYCNRIGKFVWLKLQLHYTNVGQQRLILYKSSIFPVRLLISRSTKAAKAQRYQENGRILSKISVPAAIEGPAPGESFIVLEPDSSYDTETEVSIPLLKEDNNPNLGWVLTGNHVLQLKVITWYWSEALAAQLHKRWRKYGNLWSDDVTSEPMPFKVENQHKVEDCP